MESFYKNPRFVGLKFPEINKPETLEKRYMTSLSKKALQLMSGLLKMDPADRLTGEQALRHPYFDDIREPEIEEELTKYSICLLMGLLLRIINLLHEVELTFHWKVLIN